MMPRGFVEQRSPGVPVVNTKGGVLGLCGTSHGRVESWGYGVPRTERCIAGATGYLARKGGVLAPCGTSQGRLESWGYAVPRKERWSAGAMWYLSRKDGVVGWSAGAMRYLARKGGVLAPCGTSHGKVECWRPSA
ncbi:hypothetical protein NDU88_006707 [Pleurodeles waltl]|uniref:Uncharacterized protein n=1 Tax=Pleurodeles waltl TaxID=8319 RepID=A0AAV7PP77_PLEWA|nr:hypothetical protein NDU88_006707 [Pleurodeles waltl]